MTYAPSYTLFKTIWNFYTFFFLILKPQLSVRDIFNLRLFDEYC